MTGRAARVGPLQALWLSALVLATFFPAFLEPHQDDYPLSTYPMFAAKRSAPTFFIAEGVRSKGDSDRRSFSETVRIPPDLIGTDEVMQAAAAVNRAGRSGRRPSRRLCRQIAARARNHDEYSGLQQIRIMRVQYDPIDYFVTGPNPLNRKRVARCDVQKGTGADRRKRGAKQ